MRFPFLMAIISVIALVSAACGGGGYSTPSSPSPSVTPSPSPSPTPTPALAPAPTPAPSPAPSSQVTVAIVGSAGSSAFTPNPVDVAAGSAVVWRNNDSTLHHIVLDNGTDVGNVSPGATTRSITVSSNSPLGFHCTLHPSMVGTINGRGAAEPPADPGTNY